MCVDLIFNGFEYFPSFMELPSVCEHSFKQYIFSLLEPRVSGTKADEVIDKLDFQYSHRVEAIGFSGGIWIGWKNTINLEVIRNHP